MCQLSVQYKFLYTLSTFENAQVVWIYRENEPIFKIAYQIFAWRCQMMSNSNTEDGRTGCSRPARRSCNKLPLAVSGFKLPQFVDIVIADLIPLTEYTKDFERMHNLNFWPYTCQKPGFLFSFRHGSLSSGTLFILFCFFGATAYCFYRFVIFITKTMCNVSYLPSWWCFVIWPPATHRAVTHYLFCCCYKTNWVQRLGAKYYLPTYILSTKINDFKTVRFQMY